MKGQTSADFRDWDLAPETDFGSKDANGLPIYIWRETADSRLTFGRPRYCCITPHEGRLYFTFFNPSDDAKASGGWTVFWVVFTALAIGRLGWAWFHPAPPMPFHLDESLPPFLVLLSALGSGAMLGAIAGGIWHVVVTTWRWHFGRFPGQGRLQFMPYESLTGFDVKPAELLGAKVTDKTTKTSFGVTAGFDDGTMLILTANAWDHKSSADKHRDLTMAFVTKRDEVLRNWAHRQKHAAQTGVALTDNPVSRREPQSPPSSEIPDTI